MADVSENIVIPKRWSARRKMEVVLRLFRGEAMAEGGAAEEKLRSPTFKPNLCPIKWWGYGAIFSKNR